MNRADTQTRRAKTAAGLIVSLCLNLILVVAAIRMGREPSAASSPGATANPAGTVARTQADVVHLPVTTFVTNRFDWRQLASTNFGDYVANLRAVGCPEKTIRDIIIPVIGQHYRSRQLALKEGRSFWLAGRERRLADRERDRKFEVLEQEQAELLRRLVGSEWAPGNGDFTFNTEMQALGRVFVGPVSAETFQRVGRIVDAVDDLDRTWNRRTGGIMTDEDEAKKQAQRLAMERELAALLGPSTMEEMSARLLSMFFFERVAFETLDVTPAEARQIALARMDERGLLATMESSARSEDSDWGAFDEKVKSLLGEKRFAEFQRARNSDFRELVEFTKDQSLPVETAMAVHDLRLAGVDEAARIRNDESLDAAARQQQLEEVQSRLQQAALDALGTQAYQIYLASNGRWLTNGIQR